MNHNKLVCCTYAFTSDEDQTIVEDLIIGYDEDTFNLIVLLEHSDYINPENNHSTWAEINKNDAYKLSRRLKTPMTELPSFMADCIEEWEWSEIINPTLSDVRGCFGDVLDSLIFEKCKYKIRQSKASKDRH